MTAQPVVLVPVNRLDQAKGRLASLLDPSERVALAEQTLRTVLEAVEGAGLQAAVLTADPAVLSLLPAGVRHIAEAPALRGLNAQLEYALELLDAPEVLVLHADLPLVTSAALRQLLDAAPPPPSATLVPSADGGTNAMLLRPPRGLPLAYGSGSAAAHRQNAESAGFSVQTVEIPALALDLDTPADIVSLLDTAEGRATRAGRYLVELGVPARLGPARDDPEG